MEHKIISSETSDNIQSMIFVIRGVQVMLDSDLAQIYGVESKRLNEQVKRNIERFPESFRFQLTESELHELVNNSKQSNMRSQIATSKGRGGRRYLPYVFTEQGVSMLSAVLRSETAIKVSIQIINAFVGFTIPKQGIFYDGQVYDAYRFVSDLIRKAKKSITLVDNYVDDSVLSLLSKRNKNTSTTIYTKTISKQLLLDLKKHNEQYPPITVEVFTSAHDRFLIIDRQEIYHIGASLKDLGKKWFAFSRFETGAVEMLEKLGVEK